MNNRLAITTRITRWGLQKPLTYGLLFCALLFSTNTLAVGGITIDHFPPRFDNGQNQTDLEDMRVKVLGGYVRITRRWMGSEWDWNRRWNDLEIPWAEYEDDPLVIHAFAVSSGGSGGSGSSAIVSGPIVDSLRTAITRNGQAYVRRYGTNTFENGSTRTITKTDSGYTWKDRRGNKIYYNGDGQMTSYADRNGIKVSVVRSGDYIQSIKDHHGNVVISYTWEDVPGDDGAKRLAKLQDYSGRSVIYGWNTSNQLEQVTDVLGEAWLYSYASGFQQTDPEGRVTSYSISGNGRLSGYHNADGVGFNYGYRYDDDTKQYYVSKTDATGVVTEKWHNSHGIVERKDINGETQFTAEVVLSNDSRGTEDYVDQYKRLAISSSSSGGGSGGRISGVPTTPDFGLQDPIYVKSKTVTDARGNKTIYNYDRWRNVTKRTNPDGTTVVSSFNTAYGLPLVVTDERGIVTDYAYDGNGNLKTLTEAKGTGDQRITRYTYYSNGQRKTQTTGESTAGNTALATTTYNYDAYGNLTSEKDPLEKSTLYSSFDVLGNAWTITDRRSNVWTRTFDAAGNILTDKSPLDQGQTYSYTKAGDLLTIKAANNSITTLGANASGLPTTATYPNDEKLVLEWDKADRLTAVIDANDHTRNLAYDELGRLKTLTDGESNVTTYIYKNTLLSGIHYPTYQEERDYDKRERLTDSKEKANSLEYLRSRGYDQNGNLKNSLDANQKPTDYTYDKLNRITKTIDADSGETLFEYDARDNLLQVTDPEGRKTVYSYTLRDELETETKHDFIATSKQRQFQYDDNGNLTHVITPEQELTKNSYDIANRLDKSELFAHKDNEHPVKVVTYNHNTNDQYTGYSQSLGADSANRTADVIVHSETYVYNTLEQLESVTVDFGTFQKSFSYSYYPNGLKKTYTNPEGITYTYYYNGNNQIQALHIPSEGQMAWTDFKWRAPQSITLPGGNKAILGYDDLLQPKLQLLQDNADATIASADYQYGMESNILQITSEHGSYNFDYDELYRLDKATYPWGQTSGATAAPGGLAGFETFDYDGVGNRTEQGEADKADQPPAVATSGYNNHNQLSSTDNGLTYSYNDNGHTSQRLRSAESPLTHLPAITDYIYNHDERLIAVKHDGVTVAEFAYNPDGQRIKKTASGQTTWYLYNKEGLAAEYDASGALITEYHFKPYATWMTTPLFQRTAAGQVYYYQNDHLGTPQRMLAKSGAVVWEARYGAFGEASIITETVGNNLRFPGQYYDEETGLYYNYFRYYDPATGRYVTSDPIGLAGGLNTYAYVMGNPLRYIDPNGEAPLCPPGHRAVPLKNYENEFPNYFDCKPYADTGYRRDPGPFGQICGAEGSNAAYWIPDITPGACERHDKCYDDCAKRCAGDKCKQQCDFDLMTVGRNLPYGTATYFGGDDAYDNAKRKRGCSCDQ